MRHKFVTGLVLTGLAACQPHEITSHETVACSRDLLSSAVNQYAKAAGNRFVVEAIQCEQDWAVVSGMLGPVNPPQDGPQGVGTTRIFHFEHQSWQPKASETVCGHFDPQQPDALPHDATIPAQLYLLGCLAG